MINYYTFLDKENKIVEKSCYKNVSPKGACDKIFRRYLRGTCESTTLDIVIVDLRTTKRYYYRCIGLYLDEPVIKKIGEFKFVYIKFNTMIVKIIKEMLND